MLMLSTNPGCTPDQSARLPVPSLTHLDPGVAVRTRPAIPFDATAYDEAMPVDEPGEALALPSTPMSFDWEPATEARAWRHIVLHHSASRGGDVDSIDAQHSQLTDAEGRRWRGIGYHFVIGNGQDMADGQVEATFRWHDQLPGAHAGKREYNEAGIGICLIGNFDEQAPTPRQLAACKQLVRELGTRYEIEPEQVVGHRDVKATACPGQHFPLDEIAVAAADSHEASLSRRPARWNRGEFPSGDHR